MLQTILLCTKVSSLLIQCLDCILNIVDSSFCMCAGINGMLCIFYSKTCSVHSFDLNADLVLASCFSTNLKIDGLIGIQQILLVEGCCSGYTIDLVYQCIYFLLDVCTVFRLIRTIGCLNCQFVHSLQHIVYFIQSTFCCLHHGNTILCVCTRLGKSSYLTSHLFGNSQSCCIVCCTVDLVSG